MQAILNDPRTRRFALAACAALGLAFPAWSQDAYAIGPGDVLAISFLSNPDLDRRMPVSADGSIFVPLIGLINVQDQTLSELRDQIPNLMTGAVYRERVQGESLLIPVEPDEVIIDVEEYRPVYVDGAVNAPGQLPFTVDMTVRQAIAAAEGIIDPAQRSGLTGAELRNHPKVLMAELVGTLAEIAVLEATLAGMDDIDTTEIEALAAPADLVAGAIALARNQVAVSGDILSEELSFLQTSVSESETRVIAALRHEEAMSEILATEAAEVERVEGLVARRIASSEQLTQTRRLYLQAVERFGSVQADRLAAEAALRELVLKRNQAARERALQIQDRLQELSRQAAQYRAQIDLSDSLPVSLDLDPTAAGTPQMVIFRRTGGQAQEITAMPDTLLYPGDVLNIGFLN